MNEASPAPPINREAVKVLAQAVGVREAARRMGLSEERVMKWSQRDPAGPWGSLAPAPPPRSIVSAQVSACPQPVRTASEAMADVNAENGARSRSAALRYSARNLEHLAALDPEEGVLLAPQAASLVKVAATAGDWDAERGASVSVNVLLQG